MPKIERRLEEKPNSYWSGKLSHLFNGLFYRSRFSNYINLVLRVWSYGGGGGTDDEDHNGERFSLHGIY